MKENLVRLGCLVLLASALAFMVGAVLSTSIDGLFP